MARFVPPEALWGLQLLAIVLPYLGVVVAAAAVAAGLSRQWGWAALCMLSIGTVMILPMVVAERGAGPPGEPPGDHRSPPSLKVITFNAKPEAMWGEEEALRGLLARERPHLVALQEFSIRRFADTDQIAGPALMVPFVENRSYQVAWPEGVERVTMPRPVFSRMEHVGEPTLIPLQPDDPNRDALWQSGGLTRVLYRWEGTTIAVYNLHLHSFGSSRPWQGGKRSMVSPRAWGEALRTYGSDFRKRAAQARRVRQFLDAETHPFIVCGDFNSTPYNWAYAHLARGLQDAFQQRGQGWGGTYHARYPLFRIDYVLTSDDWEVRAAHVSKAVASDHRPVVVELALRPMAEQNERK